MSFHSRKRNRAGMRRRASTFAGGHAIGSIGSGARRDASPTRASTAGTMPRLGSVLLAVVVVALLTIGLHMLFQ
jgi:hypothetical protein